MKKNKGLMWLIVITVLFSLMMSACAGGEQAVSSNPPPQNNEDSSENGGDEGAPGPEESLEPATVTFAVRSSYLNENDMQRYVIDPVNDRYPHITIETIWIDGGDNSIPNLVATGRTPDIGVTSNVDYTDFQKLNIEYDMTELIEKHEFDLDRFKSVALDGVKMA